jgi:hypothetical protein
MNSLVDLSAISNEVPTKFGTPWEGGFFAGILSFNGDVYAQVVAPKASGAHAPAIWHQDYSLIAGADSFFDGVANTKAMAEAGSEIAQWALDLRIDGRDDWHIASRDQHELLYRGLKPTTSENWVYRNGDNPSSLPGGYPYTKRLPGQTDVELFRQGSAEAFEPEWYWTSTQYSANGAWGQLFDDGYQSDATKYYTGRVRAVRRLKIS